MSAVVTVYVRFCLELHINDNNSNLKDTSMGSRTDMAKRESEGLRDDALYIASMVKNEILATRTDMNSLGESIRTTLKAPIDKFFSSADTSPDDLVATLKRWGFSGEAEEALRSNKLKQDEPRRLAAEEEYTAASLVHENLRQVLKGAAEQHRADKLTQDVEQQIAKIFNEGAWLQLPELKIENYQNPWRRLLSPAYRKITNILTNYRTEGSSFFEDQAGVVARQYAYAELEASVDKAQRVAATAEEEHNKCVVMRSSWLNDAEFKTANLRPLIDYLEIKDPIPKTLLDAMGEDIPEITQAAEQSAKYRAQTVILQRQLNSLVAALRKTQSWLDAIDLLRRKLGRIRSEDKNFKGIDLTVPRRGLAAAVGQTHTYVSNLKIRRSESANLGNMTLPASYMAHTVHDTGCSDFWLMFWLMQINDDRGQSTPGGFLDLKGDVTGHPVLDALGLDDNMGVVQISPSLQFDSTPTFDSAMSSFEDALTTSYGAATGSSSPASSWGSSVPGSSCSSWDGGGD
jgi:hypothetical protein